MVMTQLPQDFKDFLKLLNVHNVEYLMIGGYAVGYHGYPRATGDLDIWIAINTKNAERLFCVLKEFGFSDPQLTKEIFLKKDKIIRMGNRPIRIKLLTSISGVEFTDCYDNRIEDTIDGIDIKIIDLEHLKINKKECGRHKDLDDLENLP